MCLPVEFRDAAYCWQMSNSAGFKPGLRAHIWFWLAESLTSAQLKAWANSKWQGDSPVDVALFQPTQWHYTSAPVLDEGVVDPVPVRSGFVPGGEVRLVISDGVRAAVAPALTPLERPRDLADSNDPYVAELYERGLVVAEVPGKGLGVVCSNHDSHSGDSGPTQSMYFLAGTGGRNEPGYECMHEHCKDITAHVYLRTVGIIDYAKDFELVEWTAEQEAANAIIRARNAQKQPLSLDNFYAHAPSHKYLYRPTRAVAGAVRQRHGATLAHKNRQGRQARGDDPGRVA